MIFKNNLLTSVELFFRSLLMKLDHAGPVQISAHLTEVLPGVANWLLQKGVLQVNIVFFTVFTLIVCSLCIYLKYKTNMYINSF